MKSDFDIVGILNWAMENKKVPRDRGRSFRPRINNTDRDEDLVGTLYRAKRLADEYEKFRKDQERIHKEEKKEDKPKSWWDKQSFIQKVAILTATVPPVIMLQCLMFVVVIKVGASILGLR